jgi:hypothetical protein
MGQTNQPDDLLARIDRLEKKVAEVSKRSGIGNAVSRGTFTFVDSSGAPRVYFGLVTPGLATGFIFTRQDGSTALTMEGSPGAQFVALRDRSTNVIVSDDTASGQGLATPYIPYTPIKMSEITTPVVSTTSAAFVELWRIHGQKQHPKMQVQLLIQSDAATTGAVQLAEGASTVIASDTIPAADNTYHTLEGPVTGVHLQQLFIRVEVRRLSGAGAYADGKQT